MTAPQRIAIVGCGFTGTSLFHQLIQGGYPVRRVTIFEQSGRFGPGYPYDPEETTDYLINNTADTMGVEPDKRRAFLEWLETRPDLVPDLDEKGHYPRALFGLFLEEVFAVALAAARAEGIQVDCIPGVVTGLDETDDGTVVIRGDGRVIEVDAAFLTTGRCPELDRYPAPRVGMTARYYPSHIPGAVLDDVPLDAECHVLGASLSAYDVVNKLFSPDSGCRFERDDDGNLVFIANGNERRVVLCSRSGRLKKMQSKVPAKVERTSLTEQALSRLSAAGPVSLAGLVALGRRDLERFDPTIDWVALADPYAGCDSAEAVERRAAEILVRDIAGAKGQAGPSGNVLVDYLNAAQLTLWEVFARGILALDDERAYRQKHETALLSVFAACPVETAERVLALMRAGRLSVRRGSGAVRLNEAEDCYEIDTAHGVERAKVVINTTGSVDRRIGSGHQDALFTQLYEQGLVRSYSKDGETMNGIAVDMATFRAEGARSIFVLNQFLWGPGFFVSSAFMMATIARRALRGLYGALAEDATTSAGDLTAAG